jgi:uncharacterized protein involved in response to NO
LTAHPFFSIGFRPFYLGAALFACLAIPLWTVSYTTGGRISGTFPAFSWHIHEMLFGFAPAVIVGFLLTAVRNWTGLPTPSAGRLAALFGLWIAGRVAALVAPGAIASALVDLSFLPIAACCLTLPLWRARNARNSFVIGILLLLFLANVAFHGALLGWLPMTAVRIAEVSALNVVTLLMIIIGGRVIPAFSANAIESLKPKRWPALETFAVGLMVLIALIDLLSPLQGRLLMGTAATTYQLLLVTTAMVHLVRLAAWQPWKTLQNPLLLVLPVSYLWIPICLLLRGLLNGSPGYIPSPAVHALVVGAMAGLMLSMMTRSALGHTGRPLRAGRIEVTCFLAIHAAALTRVFGTLLDPARNATWITVSGILWTIAFATFAAGYLSILTAPRRAG